ncbi:MAG TPA: response regulator, partial [Anaerolineales bacterium]|nr:response regulator [Anaerolineales bacterium]
QVILVVDDNVTYCAAIAEILAAAGFKALSATSVQEAVLILADTTPDLILSDTMPLPDGISLIRILRKIDRLKDIPVVTVSGRAMPLDRAEAISGGASSFLAKPFSAAQLLEVIQLHLPRPGRRAA